MRRVGQILIGLAVAGAVAGGLFLAVQMNERGMSAVGGLTALLFIAVTGVAAAGIYLYIRGEPSDEHAAPRTETELTRRISDILGKGDRLTFGALADALDTDAQAVARLLSELTRLEVLPAAISWDSATIYPKNRGYLATQRTCLHCGEPLAPQPKSVTCPVCRTAHYDV